MWAGLRIVFGAKDGSDLCDDGMDRTATSEPPMLRDPSFCAGALPSSPMRSPVSADLYDMLSRPVRDRQYGLRRLAWISWIFLSAVGCHLDAEQPRYEFAQRSLLRLCDMFERNRPSFSETWGGLDEANKVTCTDARYLLIARDISVLAARSRELCADIEQAIAAGDARNGERLDHLFALRRDAMALLLANSTIVTMATND